MARVANMVGPTLEILIGVEPRQQSVGWGEAIGLAGLGIACLWQAGAAKRARDDRGERNPWWGRMLWPARLLAAGLLLGAMAAAAAAAI